MSVSQQPTRLVVRSVDDLVGLVPHLLGFHPTDSLVVMMLEGGRVAVTARVDLDAVVQPEVLGDLLGRLFGRFPAAEGWFLVYGDDGELAWRVLASCVEVAGFARLGRVLHVSSAQWRADRPDGPCGAIAGATSCAAAEATVLGLPALASRRDLAAGVAGPPDHEIDGLLARHEAAIRELDALGPGGRRRRLRRLLRAAGPCRLEDCVQLALLGRGREGQVAMLRLLDGSNAEQQRELWAQVVRHSPASTRPSALGLLGMAAWQTGDGALQVVCLEELERVDPDAPIAAVLELLNANVVPPGEWEAVREVALSVLETGFRGAARRPFPPGR
jgi:hypothetical protein